MPHGDLAQLSAVLGGLGAAAMLLSRTRAQLLAGLAATAVGEATLAAALIPGADLKLVVSPASHAAGLVVGLLVVGSGAATLARYPAIVPVALLAAAPFRISVSIGAQKAYLLLPLYVVLAAAALALLIRALRGDAGNPLPPLLAVPARSSSSSSCFRSRRWSSPSRTRPSVRGIRARSRRRWSRWPHFSPRLHSFSV
jgi:hypothetical protein